MRDAGSSARPAVRVIEVEGLSVHLTFKSMKNLRLRVDASGQLRVSAPWRTPLSAVIALVHRHRQWILDQQARRHAEAQSNGLWWWGDYHELHWQDHRAAQVHCEHGLAWLRCPASAWQDLQARQRLLQQCAAQAVRERAGPWLAQWSGILGVQPQQLVIRPLRSRWGSCTPATGRIGLNSALVHYRPELLEYVVVHELAHLLEANHGPRFYAVVEGIMPDWRERRKALRQPLIRPLQV